MLLFLLACLTPIERPATVGVALNPPSLVFQAEVGACDRRELTVTNVGTAPTVVALSSPLDTCLEAAFQGAGTTLTLPADSSATLAVSFCPRAVLACESAIGVTFGDQGRSVVLLGVATSPDRDEDGYREADGDCADDDPAVHPQAIERANGRDDDCDGRTDELTTSADDDGDGWSERDGDCDDHDAAVSPGVLEVLDGIDQDCDGRVDDHTDAWDDDGDGYSEGEGDCDDLDRGVLPLATEFPDGHPNGIDDDCDGEIDELTP